MNERDDQHIIPNDGADHTASPDCQCQPNVLEHGFGGPGTVIEHRPRQRWMDTRRDVGQVLSELTSELTRYRSR